MDKEKEEPELSDLIQMLPRPLQKRFESLGANVSAMLSPEGDERPLGREEVRLIQLAAFVFLLGRFLETGTRVARKAATTFESLDMNGFYVGRTVFTRDNDNTMRGEILAEMLNQALAGTGMQRIIDRASSMTRLVEELARRFRHGATLGRPR